VVIPADWKEQELSRIAEIGPGINKALSEMGTGSLYVTVEDIYHGSFLDAGRLGRIRISKSEVERFSLQVGDLVLGKSSVKRDGIGYPNLFLGCSEPVVPSGFTYRVRPDKKVLSSPFLLQYLRSRPGRKWIIDNSQSSALTNINSSIVNRYPVIIPPLKEQEAIAEALSDADVAIESLDALIAKKCDVKQATMQQLLAGRTRLPGFTADWKEVRLGEICELSLAASKKSRSDGRGKYIIADMGSVSKDGSFLTHKTTDVRDDVLRTGDLVMPKDDIGGGQIIGKAVLVDEDERYVLGDHVYRLRLSDGFPAFVRYGINSYKVNIQLRSKVVGSAQLGLGRRAVLEQPISFPPLKEQEAIAEALTVMDDELGALTEQASKLRMVKQGMMQDLLTGKVRLM
jgi:type I restriction enzyme S subunit